MNLTLAIICGEFTTTSQWLTKNLLKISLTSLIILLPKDVGRLKIHRLRIINTYESQYNLILKLFWPKEGTKKSEDNNWLGLYQQGGRKYMRAVETTTFYQNIIDIHRLTKQPLCIRYDDIMGCYDRIIRSHAILNSRKFGIPDNIYKLYSVTDDKTVLKLQLNGISKKVIPLELREFANFGNLPNSYKSKYCDKFNIIYVNGYLY